MTETVQHTFGDGSIEWTQADGDFHRDDGPAIIYADGSQLWYQNDLLHRLDGPAVILADGSREWWQNGKQHRDHGPAIIHQSGCYQIWWHHGKRHREDGPAAIWADGCEQWYLNDQNITRRVRDWVSDNDLPDWKLWDDDIRTLFRLRFL